ncbi:MAG: LptF/LptG family permease [Chroococcidiopsidaceae cyanobacterium CP_BM_ER_R8_30]|nr:LptF/LptG family permease [Chroococcidiopsidaceae cyanobacterium CP_BM_ER_R8_30]
MTSSSYKSFKPQVPSLLIMDRYITTELIPPFLFGVGAFASVGVAIGSLFDLLRKVTEAGLPMAIALKVFLLQLPYFVAYAFPMAVLLAALITYSRLASDSELIALRSCGLSIYRLVLPAIILSLVITGITFVCNEQIVPAANYEAALTLDQALKKKEPSFQQSNIVYPEYRTVSQPDGSQTDILTRIFYADQFDGQRMKGLTILDLSRPGLNQIIVANTAVWNSVQSTWDFFNGTIYIVAPDSSYREIVRFQHQQLHLPRAPLELAEQQSRDYNQMNISQALQQLKIVRLSGNEQKVRKLLIRIHQKIAIPFACVVFCLVGAILGTRPQRTSKATGFGVSVLVILAYYVLMTVGDALGLSGILLPWMAAWLPNMFGFSAGGWLLIRAGR